jgi:ATP-binding cassette subfamily B multidrug efflux pump
LLVVAITLLELSVPYITKEIIDRHILPRDRITGNFGREQAGPQRLTVDLTDSQRSLQPSPGITTCLKSGNDRAAIRLEDLDRLDQATLSQLRHTDLSGLAAVTGLFMAVVVAIFIFTFART